MKLFFDWNCAGAAGGTLCLDAIIDTGFSGQLTLSARTVGQLGLVRSSIGSAFLSDGSRIVFDVYSVELLWDGAWVRVNASCIGDEALVGAGMLRGYELRIEFKDAGLVEAKGRP